MEAGGPLEYTEWRYFGLERGALLQRCDERIQVLFRQGTFGQFGIVLAVLIVSAQAHASKN